METERAGVSSGAVVRPSAWVFVSLAGVSSALTLLFLGMRSVMDIGGACAEGGPFVPVRPCPKGVPLVMVGSIWGGLAFAGVYAWQVIRHSVPSFLGLLWPALFLSLGWNFLQYGIDPPGSVGLAWGWLVCAVVFAVMGGIPLLVTLRPMLLRFAGSAPVSPGFGPGSVGARRSAPSVRFWLALQLAAVAAGIYGGVRLFDLATS